MLSSFRLIARTIVTGKPMPYSGLDLINRVLAASGRAPVPAPTWRGWIKDLKDDTDMADAYERARPTLAKHRTPSTYPLSWSDRVDRTSHLVDVFYGLMRALRPNSVIETGVAYGMTSSLMLAAFQHNQSGKLLLFPSSGKAGGDDTRQTLRRGEPTLTLPTSRPNREKEKERRRGPTPCMRQRPGPPPRRRRSY